MSGTEVFLSLFTFNTSALVLLLPNTDFATSFDMPLPLAAEIS